MITPFSHDIVVTNIKSTLANILNHAIQVFITSYTLNFIKLTIKSCINIENTTCSIHNRKVSYNMAHYGLGHCHIPLSTGCGHALVMMTSYLHT